MASAGYIKVGEVQIQFLSFSFRKFIVDEKKAFLDVFIASPWMHAVMQIHVRKLSVCL